MEVKEDRGRSQPVNQTARLSLPCCTAWSAFMETVFCVFFSEAVIRVRYNFVSRCSRVCVLVPFHQNSSFPWKLGDVVSPGIQREVPLSRLRGRGGRRSPPPPVEGFFHPANHCNLYLCHIWTWPSDCSNFIFDLWDVSPCRNRLSPEDGSWTYFSEIFPMSLNLFEVT